MTHLSKSVSVPKEASVNPWHIVEIGDEAPDVVQAIIEVPKGSKNKYELDKKNGMIRVDRVLFSSVQYPANYGFIPQTYCDDKDPLDILVLGQEPVYPLSIMEAIPIGVMKMIDQGEGDDKIIAVHKNDPEYNMYTDISELPPHRMQEIKRFFLDYKQLEKKQVQVEDLLSRAEAIKIIKDSIALYKSEILPKL